MLVKEQDNSILDGIIKRRVNRAWISRSQSIAFRILSRIRELQITQKKLAETMGVSPQVVNKWVKGQENFTLETITKLEHALDCKLFTD